MGETKFYWLIELRNEPGRSHLPQPLYMAQWATAEEIVRLDDALQDGVRNINIGKIWTQDHNKAARYSKENAESLAGSLDRCFGGCCVAAEHGFME